MSESFERGTSARLSFANFTRKLSSFRNKEYNKVEDLYDTRIPLHNEDVFEHGLRFKSKYIGSLEIARPTCKVDIITAMRRIRYEYKVKGIRKSRVYMEVSTSGVKVTKRKSKRKRKQYSEEQLFVMSHPIYRIFYVSHDSQDLKIFSYITREVPNNTFRCNVFKAYKKKFALHIVRSLGQAFDVCHKLNPKPKKKKEKDEDKTEEETTTKDEGTEETKTGEDSTEIAKTPEAWKQFNTDLDSAMEKLSLDKEPGTTSKADTSEMDLSAELGFDPFASPQPLAGVPMGNGGPLAMDPFQMTFSTGALTGDSGAVTYPPLTVSNSTSLPDFPEGIDPATMQIPPAHLAYISRPHQQPNESQTIRENPFTEHGRSRDDSPVSIGESLDDLRHHQRKKSNPFKPSEDGALGQEKQHFTTQITLLQEQLKAETAARAESQKRVEQLLGQNKQLLSQLEKLMTQLTQIQVFQLSQAKAAAPPAAATIAPVPFQVAPVTTNPVSSSPPPPQTTNESTTSVSSSDTSHLSTSSAPSPSPDLPTAVIGGDEVSPVVEGAVTESEERREESTSTPTDQGPVPDMDLAIMLSPPATNDPFVPQTTDSVQLTSS